MTTKTDKPARLTCPDCERSSSRSSPQSRDGYYTVIDPETGAGRRSLYCKVHDDMRAQSGRKTATRTQRERLDPTSSRYDALAHERQKKSNRESMRRAREQQKVSTPMSSMQDSNWVRWVDDQGVEHYTPIASIVDVRRTPSGSVFVVLDELEIDERHNTESNMSAASQSVEHRVAPEYAEPLLWFLRTRRSAVDVRESHEHMLGAVQS